MNFEKLSNDEDFDVKCRVACDSNCPIHILEKLSNDDNWYVRSAVVWNRKCPPELKQAISDYRVLSE